MPVAVLAAFACAAGAQTMKPGLWEVTQTMQSTDARTPQSVSQMQQMANMPPEQRKDRVGIRRFLSLSSAASDPCIRQQATCG